MGPALFGYKDFQKKNKMKKPRQYYPTMKQDEIITKVCEKSITFIKFRCAKSKSESWNLVWVRFSRNGIKKNPDFDLNFCPIRCGMVEINNF